jgi:hypothetical protein
MFFVQERGGSTIFNRLISETGDEKIKKSKSIHGSPEDIRSLPVKEDIKLYPLYQTVPQFITEDNEEYCAYCMYAEDWWGQYPTDPDYCLYGPNLIQSWLPEDDWMVFALLRDGRNQITSRMIGNWMNTDLEFNKKRRPPDSEVTTKALSDLDKFERQCLMWKLKTEMHLTNRESFSNYTILKFEDMTAAPEKFLTDLLQRCNLTPDPKKIISPKVNTSSIWGKNRESQTTENQNTRYLLWEDVHYEICERVMGAELTAMGYQGRGTK